MSYSDFTIDMLRRDFGIRVHDRPFFKEIGTVEPSSWLQEGLAEGATLAVVSEKARSEFIVAPVLIACREILARKVHIFSGIRLDADPDKGLKGECDFILAQTDSAFALQGPLMTIVEAKKNDIEEGIAQCAAQLLGAGIYNEKDRTPLPYLYGCVTTGRDWQFLKLENEDLFIHPERYSIEQVGKILWFLVHCLKDLAGKMAGNGARK